MAGIPSCKQVQIAQFADDTWLFYQSKFKNIQTSTCFLERALNQLSGYIARRNIKINARKTEAIVNHKGSRKVEAPIKIQNSIIPYRPSVKYLDIALDSKLIFQSHISKTINKAYGSRRLRWSSGYHTGLWIGGPRVRSRPGAMDFQSVKILSMTSFGREVKSWVPCRRFMARKRISSRN